MIDDSAPDPADARRRFERFADAARGVGRDPDALGAEATRVLEVACARAPYLATLLARAPERLWRVSDGGFLHREKPADVIAAEIAEAMKGVATADALAAALRTIRNDELVRLGVRELEHGGGADVGRELARLAGACFDAAIGFHDHQLRAKYGAPREDGGRVATLVVIGMGKLGGEELNFSSDVDVIYVYSSDAGAAGPLSLHEYFAKLCAAVTASISEVTSDDIVFRVDLRLRPEGTQGAIANSLAQLERYYETFGRPWERQAWLKGRPCAGDVGGLGAEIMETMRPFVYPRHTAPTVIDEVMELNKRIKRELAPRGAAAGSIDVKNGVGGIREIEFFVQALQLVHARNPHLRARGTLAALDQLLFAGLVKDDEHLALWRAYRWLRHVEHVLQLESGLQTQRVPADPQARALLARRLRYPDVVAFEVDLAKHMGAVARIFATLGAPAASPRDDVAELLAARLSPEHEASLLKSLGFRDPAGAAADLARARRRPDSPLGPAATGALARVGPALVAEIATSADPDQALRYVVELGARRAAAWSVWRLLDESPPLLRLLVSILGASEYLAKSLVDRPELIDLLIGVGASAPTRTRAELATDCDHRLALARTADPGDEELAWSALAEFKNGQVLRVALADFAGRIDPLEVCGELTRIAEVCLDRALALIEASMRAKHGTPRLADGTPAPLAVLALGKLGGGELGYAADLDVVFVFAGDGASDGARPLDNVEYWTRAAQRLMTALHARTPRGKLYDLDTRLRPSGSKGLLVSSLAAWRRYHETDARLWEHQALTKLRAVAGDAALGSAAQTIAIECVWGVPHDRAAIASSVGDMRDRIEKELGAPGDLKAGKGGVIDVEFAAQALALAYGHAYPALQSPATVAVLAAAAQLGVADPADAALLSDGYRFLRLVEHRLRVVHDRAVHHLPDDAVELDKLARRAGFPDGARLAARAARWRDDIRAAYTRVLSRIASPTS
ncbi:MAG TPA: bifunctional [glutamate--ammonia ligase]-adenylyl-L-tyrosine phosphorylase/[glutamate--ammonia-ligase] adenylyltransferase [Kofleriaceae bacterium]|nr:bifunctional [glutamate--ammonia ligase]-adenylyl-L-tyrosine phosphorylase/[glutamate--ammonia-ligase] adenylyltransferase [Kofleriaceae bacterium]